jgi:hypothetical protein
MKFDDLYNELMFENVSVQDPLFKQALSILQDLKAKSPNAYAKLMDHLNALSAPPSRATKTYQVPEDPTDASWIVSAKG